MEFDQQILEFSSVISIIAEIRSLLYRENPTSKVSSTHGVAAGQKAIACIELVKAADIYLRT